MDIQTEVLGACFSESALETLCHFAGKSYLIIGWLITAGALLVMSRLPWKFSQRTSGYVICQCQCHRYKMNVYAAKLFPSFSHVSLHDFEVCTLCQIRTFAKGWMEVSQDASL